MHLLLARFRSRGLSAFLAIAILVGCLSVITGLSITRGPEHPEISLDMCHPLQAPIVAASVIVARPAAEVSEPMIYPQGSIIEHPAARLVEFIFTPDPPPPKAHV